MQAPRQRLPAKTAHAAEMEGSGQEAAPLRLVAFRLDGERYGLELTAVERVLPMVAVSPLPGCPKIVLGAINLHGDVIPVLDLRRRLGLAAVEYGPTARLLVARTEHRTVALPVDDVAGVTELPAGAVASAHSVLRGIEHLSGIAALADGLLLIHDLGAVLSIEEERQLAASLREERR